MPSKYVVREFAKDSVYHVFNRGVEKRVIFQDEQDYHLFLYYLYIYLTPLEKVLRRYHTLPIRLFNKNVAKDVDLLAYCLMPNHFHLLVKQKGTAGVSSFMKQLSNAYTQYFNHKYKRTGGLFEGRYKAIRIPTDELLVHTSRYIHLNPFVADMTKNLESYQHSSYPAYTGLTQDILISPEMVLYFFKSPHKYKEFVDDYTSYAYEIGLMKHLLLDPED